MGFSKRFNLGELRNFRRAVRAGDAGAGEEIHVAFGAFSHLAKQFGGCVGGRNEARRMKFRGLFLRNATLNLVPRARGESTRSFERRHHQ